MAPDYADIERCKSNKQIHPGKDSIRAYADTVRRYRLLYLIYRKVFTMKKTLFLTGLRDGIPIAAGYFAVSFSFGIAAVAAGLAPFEALLISMTNLTSAGQFAAIGIIAGGGSYIEMAMTQFVINLRYALMSLSLSQKLDRSFSRLHSLILLSLIHI